MRKVIGVFLFLVMILLMSVSVAENDRAIQITADTNIVYVKKQLKLQAEVTALTEDAPAKTTLVWESDQPEIAKVNNGAVTGVSAGKATIKVSAKDNPDISAVFEVEVRVPVKSIKSDPAKLELFYGEQYKGEAQLQITVAPEDAFYQEVTFASSNEEVVTVDDKGHIVAAGPGKAKVTVSATEPESSVKAEINILVKQAVDSIVISENEVIVAEKKSVTVKPVPEPKNAANKQLEWTSSDENIAKVTNSGSITGVSCGTATITATAKDTGVVSGTVNVTVIKEIKKIAVDNPKLTLHPGIDWKQAITITPEDASIQKLTWTSSNDGVATVDEHGIISPVAAGKCTLTAVAQDGYKAKVQVSVEVKDHDIAITVPGDASVNFPTTYESSMAGIQIGSRFWGTIWETDVQFKNGCVVPSDGKEQSIYPIKPGSDIITVTEKENRRVTSKKQYMVFVAQTAVIIESDEEIGRLEAESYEGHTYQLFYSGRTWDEAEAFCERHGGHLVTITTQNEQKFIERYLDKAEKKESYWIGLNSGKSKSFSSWVTKEAISFTKWMDDNPDRNDQYTCARIAASKYTDRKNWTMDRGSWDDESNHYQYINGFICEWEEENSPNALPLPEKNESGPAQDAESEPDIGTVVLTGGVDSPYGKELMLNEGTDSETVILGYFLPAGTYNVTNLNAGKAVKIVPYENVRQNVDGTEEFKPAKSGKQIMLFPGKSGQMIVGDNEFVCISDDEYSVSFERE